MVRACNLVGLSSSLGPPIGMLKKMLLDSIGNILIKDLRSSGLACCAEHSLHGLRIYVTKIFA